MKVRWECYVSQNALPALITVRSFDGRLILCERIYRKRNVLFFRAESKNLIITVRPYSDDFFEKSYYFKFGAYECYGIRLDLTFTERNAGTQRFYLMDENYLFPVKNAALLFRGRQINAGYR